MNSSSPSDPHQPNLYTARFGTLVPGDKVFVQINQFQDGHESIPADFTAVVPAQ
jgi:hypothetical protein